MAPLNAIKMVVDFLPVPCGRTIVDVLAEVYSLCKEVGEAKTTCTALHGRLEEIFYELERMESAGGLDSQAVDKYTKTLEEYCRHLAAFRDMNTIERLVRHRKLKKAIASINTDVDNLVVMVQLSGARFLVDWRRQYEEDMREQQETLASLAHNAAEIQSELRGPDAKRDALILLKATVKQIEDGKSELPDQVQTAVKQAYRIVANIADTSVGETPSWYLDEADIDYDMVPFACGAASTVHKGTLNQHTRVVVKMVMANEGGLDPRMQQDFLNEANLWSTLHHPHVVHLVGACHLSNRPFLVCYEAEHRDMAWFLRKAPTNRDHTWQLLYEASQGIQYLHHRNIIHGDVRLSNILVTGDIKALVADFGMARIKNNSKSKSMTKRQDGKEVEGRARWLAPEAIDNKAQYPSDVYGLAMAMLEAFNGEPPFANIPDENTVKTKVRDGELPPRPNDMSDRVWELFLKMTKKEQAERMVIGDVVNAFKQLAKTEQAPPASACGGVAPVAVAPSPPLPSSDLQQLLVDLKNDVNAAKQLTSLASQRDNAQPLLTPSSIHALITALQDTTSVEVQEQVSCALAYLATYPTGAELVGGRGGVLVLAQLLSSPNTRVQQSVQRALIPLLKNPLNSLMFVHAGGVTALASLVEKANRTTSAETLDFVRELLQSSSAELARAVAANKSIVQVCVDRTTSEAPNERDAAGQVLLALAKSDPLAVRAIDTVGGFETLVKRTNNNGDHVGETLVAAIKTLLRVEHNGPGQTTPSARVA